METGTIAHSSKCNTCSSRCGKLEVFDWLSDLPDGTKSTDIVEVQFKNTRKGFYRNSNQLKITKGDIVAVEASPGHDIGIVTLTGELVLLQMKKNNLDPANYEFKRIYRKAKPVDIEKWEEAKALEHDTMLESRRIAEQLNLNMKIGDVEYQGDRTKAIFYYIADERVDFRELIKVLADRFKVRIEMRQIGARQEAGRIGGIGPCGRELCCSTWITNFESVTTNAARYQEISLNPQKLAGQCGKLKCCLNYELDTYIDAQKDFPPTDIPLETETETYHHVKTDIFKRLMWYASGEDNSTNMVMLSVDKVKEIIELNKKGQKVEKLTSEVFTEINTEIDYTNVVGEDSITRFDNQNKKSSKKKKSKRRKSSNKSGNGGNQNRRFRNKSSKSSGNGKG
ncbi:PSP1 domain-containing protein [Thermophagus xiamenensis]|uniref:Cell fate regulator YaaT, PSP1 superfamily (Controls sporulation, competence, biofilm development) n=1 Tax=Thermophagus xiamenensis TaxID=385682 RepID=A0A1I1Y7T8_9BACT|nr:regulatory iron-sulfur-containing complex subunit RicT [Thermophagus xiamenensis]SFE15705.1 Cell fate regulator YaaT, PSP1 superfamily (controls sporulation, competence, biofilm development) [Thermophagus xiamenensis]